MRTITMCLIAILCLFAMESVSAQVEMEFGKAQIEKLENVKEQIKIQEKQALKQEVEEINKKLELGEISKEEAAKQKTEAAKKRALNIEDRLSIVDNKIKLLQRNGSGVLELDTLNYLSRIEIGFGKEDGEANRLFGIKLENNTTRKNIKYDKRTSSDLFLAVGLNNAIIDGQSLEDTPYKVGGSRFFEMGWQWRTRVFQNSNFLRFNYGVSFQFNGLKPKDNQYFLVNEAGQTVLEEFSLPLDKSKLRMDNLVFPLHLEFGPSKLKKTENTIRYSLKNQFRLGIGGYTGVNLGTTQKLKYERDGRNVKDKLKGDYNTSDFIYGLSAYAGFDGVLLYVKYDLNPIFQDAAVTQRNISLGLRWDL